MKNIFFTSLMVGVLTACNSMPTSGPSQSKVMGIANDADYENKVDVIDMNDSVANKLFEKHQFQSFTHFVTKAENYTGAVKSGDTLSIMLWEAPPAILFGAALNENGSGGSQLTTLPEQVVSKKGNITVPFIGEIAVVGKTPEEIQRAIVKRLKPLANQPQTLVRLVGNNAANVIVLRQGNSVRMPLTPVGERVLDAVAAVGGATENIQDVSVQLARGNQVKTLSLDTLAANPEENIRLREGDIVTLLNTPLTFTGLGAIGRNQQVKFAAKGITLAEAIGRMGGLLDSRSDPQGVFVFRYVPFSSLDLVEQDNWKQKGYTVGMDIPRVYRINLLEPNSLFWLQRFPVEDKDLVYVSNAPLAEFQKFLRIIFSIVSPVISTTNSIGNM